MSMKKLAAFAAVAAVSLVTALPASALDREDRAPRERHRVPTATQSSASQPQITTSGKDNGRLRVSRQRGDVNGVPSFFAKADSCSFNCGDMTVTCSGASAACGDSACVASGGGITIIAWCEST